MTNKAEFDALMHFVCVEWGYCGGVKHDRPWHVTDIIPPNGPVTADQFVEWVFLAENMNPNLGPAKHKSAIRAAFVEIMGAEVVDAQRLQWDLGDVDDGFKPE